MDLKLKGFFVENIFLSEKTNGSGYCFCSANFYHSSLLFNEEWKLVLKVFYLLREGLFHILVWWLLSLGQVQTIPLKLMWPPTMKLV